MDTKNNSAVEGALASLPKARASRQRQVAKGDITVLEELVREGSPLQRRVVALVDGLAGV